MTTTQMSNIMDALFEHRASSLPPSALAEVFDRLLWCLDDNGAALLKIREQWLVSDDKDRVAIALAMNESYPFVDAVEMRSVMSRIAGKWPEFARRCQDIVEKRQNEYGDQ